MNLTTHVEIKALRESQPFGRFSREQLIKEHSEEKLPPRKRQNIEEPADPFADEAQTETNTADGPPPWEVEDESSNETKNTDTKDARVVVSAEGKIVQTYKFGSGYDKPWLVVHSGTVLEALLSGGRTRDELDGMSPKEQHQLLMDDTYRWGVYASKKDADASGGGNTRQASNTSQNGSQGREQGRPAAATDGPWGPQTCKHGQMKFWSGMGDDGLWQGYFCPADRNANDKCKNKYVK